MKHTRRAAALLGLTLAATFGVGAHASAGSNLCPANKDCLYVDTGYVGLMGYQAPGIGVANVSNDRMSSWENKTATGAAWYDDANGGGGCHTMGKNSQNSDVGWWDSDEASSWRTNRGC